MRQKILSLLVLLLTAATGAWAQATFGVKEITPDMVPDSWNGDNSEVTAADLANWGFKEVTEAEAKTWTGAPQQVTARLIYTISSGCESLDWEGGVQNGGSSYIRHNVIYLLVRNPDYSSQYDFFITTEPTTEETTNAEAPIEVTTNAASEGATFTEAWFNMPAFDATADYELVRDMTYQVNAYVGTTPDADYRHRVEMVSENLYMPVDITTDAQLIALFPVIDIIDAQNPKTLTYGTDYTLAIVDEQENEIDPADFNFAPGTYTVKVTGKGDYDGQIESLNKFELYFGYELTVGPGEFATFYKDEALTLDENETEAQLYTITAVGTKTATATELTIAAANTPILVKNTSEEAKTILLIPTVDDADEVTAANEFIGTLEATTIAASTSELTNYAFNGKQFVWVKDAIEVGANKAWLAIPTGEATARTITLVFGDATGVNAVESGKWKVESFYDLNGRKVNAPTKKGIYILNGRKVVIK